MVFTVYGYWKDDGSSIDGLLITDYSCVPDGYTEDDIFFFGLSEDDIKLEIELGEETGGDFVITRYEVYDAED